MYIKEMRATTYIEQTRRYLMDFEKHLTNIVAAFDELTDACADEGWVKDEIEWNAVKAQIEKHDVSKFSKSEFVPFRDVAQPRQDDEFRKMSDHDVAMRHHLEHNPYHPESAETERDIVHMVVQWIALSYSCRTSPRTFYAGALKAKDKPLKRLTKQQKAFIERLFDNYERHRMDKSVIAV